MGFATLVRSAAVGFFCVAIGCCLSACGGGSEGAADDAVQMTESTVDDAVQATESTVDDAVQATESTVDGIEELFPDVVGATAEQADDGTWTVSATLSSPYDTPERYADAWRVVGPDGEEYGVRELAHDHANEQPFTRSSSGIVIPENVDSVTVEGRDQVSGWGGQTFELSLQR